MNLSAKIHLTLVTIFALSVCFSHLGQGSLAVDAVRYAFISVNILKSGDWFNLTDQFTQAPYTNKPHLLFWLLALSFKTFGYSTFVAKLPSGIFAACAIIGLWIIALRHFNATIAYCSVLLFVANRVFMRDILDLNFEAIVICGALLLINFGMVLAKRQPATLSDWILAALGFFLILQSKPPYIILSMGPLFIWFLLYRRQSFLISKRHLVLVFTPLFLAITMWGYYLGLDYFSLAYENQIAVPMQILSSYQKNLTDWASAFFVSYAPYSWIFLCALYSVIACRKNVTIRPVQILFVLWLLPILILPFFIDSRPRYLLVPMLGAFFFSLDFLHTKKKFVSENVIAFATLGISLLCIFVFTFGQVMVHRENPFSNALKQISLGHQDEKMHLCLDGEFDEESQRLGRFAELLLELEFGRQFKVQSSKQLIPSLKTTEKILAEPNCKKAFQSLDKNFSLIVDYKKTSLFQMK